MRKKKTLNTFAAIGLLLAIASWCLIPSSVLTAIIPPLGLGGLGIAAIVLVLAISLGLIVGFKPKARSRSIPANPSSAPGAKKHNPNYWAWAGLAALIAVILVIAVPDRSVVPGTDHETSRRQARLKTLGWQENWPEEKKQAFLKENQGAIGAQPGEVWKDEKGNSAYWASTMPYSSGSTSGAEDAPAGWQGRAGIVSSGSGYVLLDRVMVPDGTEIKELPSPSGLSLSGRKRVQVVAGKFAGETGSVRFEWVQN